ncbi:MAG: preQ(1) synthase [Deltaproteobacteria bacterium]
MAKETKAKSKTTIKEDLQGLTLLGANDKSKNKPSKTLEKFPNHHQRDYVVTLDTDEFTCLCPMTGQPDFAQVNIEYIPDKYIVESKSLKLYLQSYRNEGCFHEHVTNVVLDDLIKAIVPKWCKITMSFNIRGGIAITVSAEHKK